MLHYHSQIFPTEFKIYDTTDEGFMTVKSFMT